MTTSPMFTEISPGDAELVIPTIIALPKDAKTVIDTNFEKGIRFAKRNDWGMFSNTNVIIPHIKNIQIIQNRVVIVIFADDTKEKAVLDNADTFSLEQGISICITKKILSMQTNGNGSSAYNKLISHCLKVYKDNRKADEQAAKEKEKKAADKARAKRIKKANRNRERDIEIQKEAYLRAMRELNDTSNTVAAK